MITNIIIAELYKKYEKDGDDKWDVAACIINELVTREQFKNDPEYFYYVHATYNLIEDYIQFSYEKDVDK